MVVKGRDLKVRFAVSSSLVKVENIHPLVSNELLSDAFAQFGEVEEAVVVTDDRGKSKGCGIVEFARKQSAMNAISQCRNAPFLLTRWVCVGGGCVGVWVCVVMTCPIAPDLYTAYKNKAFHHYTEVAFVEVHTRCSF